MNNKIESYRRIIRRWFDEYRYGRHLNLMILETLLVIVELILVVFIITLVVSSIF